MQHGYLELPEARKIVNHDYSNKRGVERKTERLRQLLCTVPPGGILCMNLQQKQTWIQFRSHECVEHYPNSQIYCYPCPTHHSTHWADFVVIMASGGDTLLYIGVCYKFLASHVILQEIYVSGYEIRLQDWWFIAYWSQCHNHSQVQYAEWCLALSCKITPPDSNDLP